MKTIFAELYNRIMDFFQGDKGEQTSQCAANRLQVILMHDRTKLDSATMAKMREELIGVFSKYVIIDNEELEIGLKSEGDSVALMLNIPIIRAKTEEELREALMEEEHADETVEEVKDEMFRKRKQKKKRLNNPKQLKKLMKLTLKKMMRMRKPLKKMRNQRKPKLPKIKIQTLIRNQNKNY